jgi:hypothetical protein
VARGKGNMESSAVCTVIGEEMRRKAAAWEWKRRAGRRPRAWKGFIVSVETSVR